MTYLKYIIFLATVGSVLPVIGILWKEGSHMPKTLATLLIIITFVSLVVGIGGFFFISNNKLLVCGLFMIAVNISVLLYAAHAVSSSINSKIKTHYPVQVVSFKYYNADPFLPSDIPIRKLTFKEAQVHLKEKRTFVIVPETNAAGDSIRIFYIDPASKSVTMQEVDSLPEMSRSEIRNIFSMNYFFMSEKGDAEGEVSYLYDMKGEVGSKKWSSGKIGNITKEKWSELKALLDPFVHMKSNDELDR